MKKEEKRFRNVEYANIFITILLALIAILLSPDFLELFQSAKDIQVNK